MTGAECTLHAVSTQRASTSREEASPAPVRLATAETGPSATTSTSATQRRTRAIAMRNASTRRAPTVANVTRASLARDCQDNAKVRIGPTEACSSCLQTRTNVWIRRRTSATCLRPYASTSRAASSASANRDTNAPTVPTRVLVRSC